MIDIYLKYRFGKNELNAPSLSLSLLQNKCKWYSDCNEFEDKRKVNKILTSKKVGFQKDLENSKLWPKTLKLAITTWNSFVWAYKSLSKTFVSILSYGLITLKFVCSVYLTYLRISWLPKNIFSLPTLLHVRTIVKTQLTILSISLRQQTASTINFNSA